MAREVRLVGEIGLGFGAHETGADGAEDSPHGHSLRADARIAAGTGTAESSKATDCCPPTHEPKQKFSHWKLTSIALPQKE